MRLKKVYPYSNAQSIFLCQNKPSVPWHCIIPSPPVERFGALRATPEAPDLFPPYFPRVSNIRANQIWNLLLMRTALDSCQKRCVVTDVTGSTTWGSTNYRRNCLLRFKNTSFLHWLRHPALRCSFLHHWRRGRLARKGLATFLELPVFWLGSDLALPLWEPYPQGKGFELRWTWTLIMSTTIG